MVISSFLLWRFHCQLPIQIDVKCNVVLALFAGLSAIDEIKMGNAQLRFCLNLTHRTGGGGVPRWRRDLLLSTVTKVGKSTGRNLRFLHLPARYALCESVCFYHTITRDFHFRPVKRIVSAPAPLPLMPTPDSTVFSTVAPASGSDAGRKSIRRGVKKTCRGHVFSLRSRRLCRRSIYLELHRKT